MRGTLLFLFFCGLLSSTQADVTVVQSIQAVGPKGVLQPAQEMTLYLTHDKLRLDSGDISSIIRADKKMTYSLLHADKAFVAIPHTTMPEMGVAADAEPLKVKRTGKNEKINGFNCIEVEVEQSDGTFLDAWLSQDPVAAKAQDTLSEWQAGKYAPVLAGMGLRRGATSFPGMEGMAVRTTVLDERRQPTVRVELKQLSGAAIRPDLFEPPAGYKQTSMDAAADIPMPDDASEFKKVPDVEGAPSAKP